jgi:hypothetical protein
MICDSILARAVSNLILGRDEIGESKKAINMFFHPGTEFLGKIGHR